jgi:hypothetical protein
MPYVVVAGTSRSNPILDQEDRDHQVSDFSGNRNFFSYENIENPWTGSLAQNHNYLHYSHDSE